MDQQLHKQVLARAGGQIHRISHHMQLYMAPFQLEDVDGAEKEKWENIASVSERILRSFLVTGDIWESERLVNATLH